MTGSAGRPAVRPVFGSLEVSGDRGVHAAALASLPRAGPRRLHRLLAGCGPAAAWRRVRRGLVSADAADETLRSLWVSHAAAVDINVLADRIEGLDIWVTTPADAGHPERFSKDIDPAPIIFRKGRPVDAELPAVTIVGTRRCSPTGRSVAYELGAGLAESGVRVVSGLALGIDGAAHRGVLSVAGVPPVGVVGSGINVVYPRGNSDLWGEMGESGTLLSEAPLDGKPEPWRFPARNRLLAALADVLVVVESKQAGGSMLTVEEALRRGVTVMAVPGSVRNPAAAGVNQLISDGCAPACNVEDVLTAVSLATSASADRTAVPGYTGSGSSVGAGDCGNGIETECRAGSSGGADGGTARIQPGDAASQGRESQDGDGCGSAGRGLGCGEVVGLSAAGVGGGLADQGVSGDPCGQLNDLQRRLLGEIDDNPVSLDCLVSRMGVPVPAALKEISGLEAMGFLATVEGRVMRI